MTDIIVGNYKTTSYSIDNNSKRIIVKNMFDKFDKTTIKLIAKQNYPGFIIGAPSSWLSGTTINDATNNNTAPGALTAGSPTTGGSVNLGAHSYKVTFVNQYGGQTALGTVSSTIIATTNNKTVPLTNIPTGATGTGTVGRYIYRTISGNTGNYKLLTKINDNITTSYIDTKPDSQLGVDGPLLNDSSIYAIDIDSSLPSLLSGDSMFIYYQALENVIDYDLDVEKIVNQSPEWSHYTDQSEPIDYSNQASGTTRDVLYVSGYENFFIGLVGSAGASSRITVTFQIPLKSSCVDTDDVNWKDITKDLTGLDNIYVNPSGSVTLYWIWNIFPTERLMIKSVFGGASTNTLTISTKLA